MRKTLKFTFQISTLVIIYLICTLFQPRTLQSDDVDRISYFPSETDQVLNNPYMGFVVDARYDNAKQPYSLAHMNITWRALEATKGTYTFEEIEANNNFSLWKSKGVKLIVRVILDMPTSESHKDIPDWLYESIQKQGTWYDMQYGKGFSPNYNNEILIQEHKRLIQAIAERYNNDPQIAFIELGSIGHWGEWHTKTDDKTNIPFPKRQITEQYAHHYINAFSNKHLMIRRPMTIAKKYNMGLFNDAFGDITETKTEFLKWMTEGYTDWLTGDKQPAMPDFWTKAPSGGELFHDTKDFEYARIDDTIEQAQLTHVSWMGPTAPYGSELGGKLQKNIDRFLKTIGYRFVIVSESHELSAKAGEDLNVQITINNRGVAPFYFQWPLELTLQELNGNIIAVTQSNSDIRTWLPGKHIANGTLTLPANITPGNYKISAAIIDPDTKKPGVSFANEGLDANGRYVLGTVTIPSVETTALNTEKIHLGHSLEQLTAPQLVELIGGFVIEALDANVIWEGPVNTIRITGS